MWCLQALQDMLLENSLVSKLASQEPRHLQACFQHCLVLAVSAGQGNKELSCTEGAAGRARQSLQAKHQRCSAGHSVTTS